MHDIRLIRENPEAFDAGLARRGVSAMSSNILAIDESRRAKIRAAEEALAARNAASKLVGAAKASGTEAEFERLRALVADKRTEIANLEEEANAENARLNELLMGIPNIPAEDAPDGADENDNVEVKRHGNPRNFAFTPKEHYEIAGAADGLDFEMAAKLSGSRFVVLSGAMVRLHRALGQFMLDTHIDKNGLTEMWVPVLVRDEAMLSDVQPEHRLAQYSRHRGLELVRVGDGPVGEIAFAHVLLKHQHIGVGIDRAELVFIVFAVLRVLPHSGDKDQLVRVECPELLKRRDNPAGLR